MLIIFVVFYLTMSAATYGWLATSGSLDDLLAQELPPNSKASDKAVYVMCLAALVAVLTIGWPVTLWAYLDTNYDDNEF